ncbi:MAG: peptidoglycan editing factor PgeF [Candidatus Harrisonbacteria bacterium CG10_big_fil_rev_8_21_14_0_10_45_28]|uniref:Purine nucleoside phosphorylase n=1 Tax=Candidatus Harrisonbacteria bacterium CG10_big_fil_rev_8_21_14_0_10_45_28 TaxID=1974586 RepID=A0A2H0UMK6_9BACT|nr:MAG: peptidoglycan editing factor PgeF [Candidatus Harrisonbacteria bacterium CG10_big_fil_rev_8_21_14_0_10_45_28]
MFELFNKTPIQYGFSTRANGTMFIRSKERDKNLGEYLKTQDIKPGDVVSALLAHGVEVADVGANHQGQKINDTDGLVTNQSGVYLTVTGADCFPVFAYSPSGVVGIAHVGWPGAQKNIVSELVAKMKLLGAELENILIGIGPGLQKCHFEIQQDVADFFEQYEGVVKNTKGKKYLNLPEFISQQLEEAGVLRKNIEISPECTHCEQDKYFSYRRDKSEEVQAMVAYIGLL